MSRFFRGASAIRKNTVLRHCRQRQDGDGRGFDGRSRDCLGGGAEIYGGRILRRSIESDRQNFTRFFLLRTPEFARRHPVEAKNHTAWKTTVVFSTRNIPGALFRALSAFALRDLNLTKIESRPLRGKPWEYLFYLDFLDRVDSPNAQNALNHLRELADFLRVLGCYPKGA